ncbi:hypothetical protein [Mixta mediterraneensis]|uniref:hypothetical protein n=1 Tax=Mixta mediterraneensis TaxID=2758443 RepID=UPI001875E4B8|nr:hypothetical protein [Mixta mediterraneensis]MBE5251755.1 hypothetical protein [Mixta mediterraneensis]
MSNKTPEQIIAKHRKFAEWKPVRVVAELVKAGMDQQQAEVLVKSITPARKEHKPHKPHNSHAKPVNMEDLSTHYIVVGDYDMLTLQHQDALIAAVRCANGRPSRHDGATAIKLFNLVKSYPYITTAEVNKHLNRHAFIDSIPLYIDGIEVAGEPMPSADNDFVKELFRAVKQLRKIVDGLKINGDLEFKKFLERVPTDEDVKRAVGIVAPKIINPHFHKIDYERDYRLMPHPAHRDDSKRIINEWKEQIMNKGHSKPNGRTLASDTDSAAAGGSDA